MVDCPECGESVVIGLPRDATIEAVTTDQPESASESTIEARTVKVCCSANHDVYVQFSVENPDKTTENLQNSINSLVAQWESQ